MHWPSTKASIVAVIHRLEKAKLVERRRSTVDRRRQGLFLTLLGARRVSLKEKGMRRHEGTDRMTPTEAQQCN